MVYNKPSSPKHKGKIMNQTKTRLCSGHIVKALDFPGNPDHYIVARVLTIEHSMVTAAAIKRVVEGSEVSIPRNQIFKFPEQDEHFMDAHFPGRITILD
jgi:hypothetical protein